MNFTLRLGGRARTSTERHGVGDKAGDDVGDDGADGAAAAAAAAPPPAPPRCLCLASGSGIGHCAKESAPHSWNEEEWHSFDVYIKNMMECGLFDVYYKTCRPYRNSVMLSPKGERR